MLQLKNITKDYIVGQGKVHALKGISLELSNNEFLCVLGPSGCGKTTLMNIIGGLDRYTSGELFIDGISTTNFKDADWDNYRNKKIGFIFQNYNLIPHLNVLENVEMALTISGISKEERKRRAKDALEQVGLFDQLKQRPNQLSGGQMQRVAIARALVNSPEILLADEPTGSLDTDTSGQIMELISQVSKDRLVIMVTHNPQLAQKYSTRIINMVDGKIISDDKPQAEAKNKNAPKDAAEKQIGPEDIETEKDAKRKNKKTAMSFFTALSLSGKNLATKKGRTALTSVAGSIGIIGIALILALSGGMNNYITKLQSDTLASNPVTITTSSININQAMEAMNGHKSLQPFPSAKEIYVQKAISASEIMSKNNITQEYLDYIAQNLDAAWYSDIIYKTGLSLSFYGIKSGQTVYDKLISSGSGGGMSALYGSNGGSLNMLPDTDLVTSQYDVLEGTYPQNKNEIVLIISDTNEIAQNTLISLGIASAEENWEKYAFADILGRQYKILTNDQIYQRAGSKSTEKSPLDIDFEEAETLTVVGILRVKENTDGGVMSNGIGYLKELYAWLQEQNYNSKIVQFMEDNPSLSPYTGLAYTDTLTSTKQELREKDLRGLGGEKLANEISVYPLSFQAKNNIKEVLSQYNTGRDKDDMVTYTDMSELLGDTLSTVVDTISYVLIAFTAISLVVSSIMIAIITYVSVLERTKEIGILRSIGARKKDVTRVFNAETVIIGLIAGVMGVAAAYLLSLPINIIIEALLGVSGIASLNPLYALMLIAISVALTLISGLIPSRKAARQDPVAALRTE